MVRASASMGAVASRLCGAAGPAGGATILGTILRYRELSSHRRPLEALQRLTDGRRDEIDASLCGLATFFGFAAA